MAVNISFRADDQTGEKLRTLASQTGWTASQVLRHLVHVADVAPVTTYEPAIKNTSTPGRGVPVSSVGSGIGQDTGQISN